MSLRFGSVCSGIEAASVAWNPLGWEASFFSEIEPFPCAVLKHHYPSVPNLGDMTKFQEWPDADIDVLVGGTPCQSFSVAGLRKGLDDPRGNLMLTFGGIAARYRPSWLVWENVPGVLSSDEGRDFAALLGLLTGQEVVPPAGGWQNAGVLAGIESAYGVAWRVLDAQYVRVDGYARAVPQRRRRVFVVGYLGDWRRAAAVLFERESMSGYPAPRREAGKAAPTIPSRSTAGGGLGTDFDCDGGLVARTLLGKANSSHAADQDTYVPTVSPALKARDCKGPSSDGDGDGAPLIPVAYQCQGSNVGEMGTLRSGNGNVTGGVPFVAQPVAPTIGSSGAGTAPQAVAHRMAVRRLTPLECERLQGFTEGHTRIPVKQYKSKPRGKHIYRFPDLYEENEDGTWTRFAADGPRYKALGNSMAIPPMRWICRRIDMVEAIAA